MFAFAIAQELLAHTVKAVGGGDNGGGKGQYGGEWQGGGNKWQGGGQKQQSQHQGRSAACPLSAATASVPFLYIGQWKRKNEWSDWSSGSSKNDWSGGSSKKGKCNPHPQGHPVLINVP